MNPFVERAELLLAVPTAANVLEALEQLKVAVQSGRPPAAETRRRLAALLDNALAIRMESLRLSSGTGNYSARGAWEAAQIRGNVAVEA